MGAVKATIAGTAGAVPDYVLTNAELSTLVDTTDDWIAARIGIQERRIIKEPGQGASSLGAKAVVQLLAKTQTRPEDVDLLICATVTPDYQFPATANLIAHQCGIRNAFGFDLGAGCSGFVYALITAAKYVESGRYKNVVVVGCEKMSAIVDYTDRATCPIFGDGAGAVLLRPTQERLGVMDHVLQSDGAGWVHLHQKAGGSVKPASHESVAAREHFIYQEGQAVFKWAVSKMADVSLEVMQRNGLAAEDIAWFVPHQANIRIMEAVAKRIGMPKEKVMVNIEKYGNTTAATIPLCLWEWEHQLKKGDNIILASFGAGFTWGAVYLKWAY